MMYIFSITVHPPSDCPAINIDNKPNTMRFTPADDNCVPELIKQLRDGK